MNLLFKCFKKYEEFKDSPEIFCNISSDEYKEASLYSSDEMLQNISGESLNSSYFLKHLNNRFIQ